MFGFTNFGIVWLGVTVFCLIMFARIPQDRNVRTPNAMFWAAAALAVFTFPAWGGFVMHR